MMHCQKSLWRGPSVILINTLHLLFVITCILNKLRYDIMSYTSLPVGVAP